MKHLFTFLFILSSILAFSQTAYSVCNRPGFDADFSDLQTAINTVPNGSILLIQGSPTSYGSVTITKPLILSGPGYFLDQNPQTQAAPNQFNAIFDEITLDNGANNCLIEGLQGESIYLNSVTNPIIQSCNLTRTNGNCINTINTSNLQIKKCYIYHYKLYSNYDEMMVLSGVTAITNSLLFAYSQAWNGNTYQAYLYSYDNVILENNTIYAEVYTDNSIIQNNIINGSISGNNNVITNNILLGTSPVGATNGNQEGVNMSTVFLGGSSPDAQYQLKIGSTAIGAGLGGVDCGAFGGSSPYLLSGMSYNPNIWDVTMPASGTSNGGLNVTVKANANQ